MLQCCNPELNGGGGWGIFNAILGWTNSATYGSVISYNMYWLAIIISFLAMRYNEKKGHWPFMKPKSKSTRINSVGSETSSRGEGGLAGKKEDAANSTTTTVRSVKD